MGPIKLSLAFISFISFYCLEPNENDKKSKVYWTKTISDNAIVELFKKLNVEPKGNVALKVHSGEDGGIYFLTPNFLQKIYEYTKGTFVECNAAYKNKRHTSALHREVIKDHGWLDKERRFVLMDEDEKDATIEVQDTKYIKENLVGTQLKNFDSNIVLAHFKGHQMGGFGGALKQLSIGYASRNGKANIHSAGKTKNWEEIFKDKTPQEDFTYSMAVAAGSIINYFKNKGGINAYINVMVNISLYCDCAGSKAPEPKIHDIGIFASLDPVAIDRACIDQIKAVSDEGKSEWLEQLDKMEGENTIKVAESLGLGTQKYELEEIQVNSSFKTKINFLILILGIVLILF